MRSLKVLLVLLIVQCALARQSAVTFTGTVVDSASSRPLPRTTLELRPVGADPTQAYPGLSNESGQFTFRNIPAGNYTLTAARNGYVRTDYGQRGPNGKGMTLRLAAGQQPPAIRLALTQSGAVSGRITDPAGVPYPYVQIYARRFLYSTTQRPFIITSSTYTNDLGEYRLWNLPPGQYLLTAEVNTNSQGILPVAATMIPPLPGGIVIDPITRGSMQSIPDPANLNQRRNANLLGGPKAPAYYRNSTNERSATIIDLKPGNDLNGIDFVAGTTAMLPLTINLPPGTSQFQFLISPSQMTVSVNFRPGTSVPSFQFTIAPGSYSIAGQGRNTAGNSFIAYGSVEVNPLNPATVTLIAGNPIEVAGRITVEGQNANPDVSKLRIRLRRSPPIPGIPEFVATPVAASFSKTQPLIDGDYSVEVSGFEGTLNSSYVKSIRVKDTALPGNTLHIGSEALTDIEVLLGTRGGQLEGNAMNAAGEAWSNVVVVLVPDQRSRYDLYRMVTTDAAGRYRAEGISPGTYKLFSWEDVEPDAWYNPDFMRTQEDRGKAVQIGEGGKLTLDAAIIPMR